jgi:hypothetical protein
VENPYLGPGFKIKKFSRLLHAWFIGLCEDPLRGATRSVSLTSKDRMIPMSSKTKLIHEIKIDAGNASILRIDIDSADRETENEERAD